MKENCKNEKVLKVIAETEILGKKIQMYGCIENPLFLAKDVAEWIDYSKSNGKYKVSQMVKTVDDDEKGSLQCSHPWWKSRINIFNRRRTV